MVSQFGKVGIDFDDLDLRLGIFGLQITGESVPPPADEECPEFRVGLGLPGHQISIGSFVSVLEMERVFQVHEGMNQIIQDDRL